MSSKTAKLDFAWNIPSRMGVLTKTQKSSKIKRFHFSFVPGEAAQGPSRRHITSSFKKGLRSGLEQRGGGARGPPSAGFTSAGDGTRKG